MTDPKNLESWLHEKAGPAYDALKADPARAITPDQVRRTLDELLAEAEASGQYPLPPSLWRPTWDGTMTQLRTR